MVQFVTPCPPVNISVYSTVPITANVVSSVQFDFNVGSFAQFGNPLAAISIQDNASYHGQSHLQIREMLDQAGSKGGFLLIDNNTESSHSLWWVESTTASMADTAQAKSRNEVVITHPGEAFTLWEARILTQDFPVQYAYAMEGQTTIGEMITGFTGTYDPHNLTTVPFTLGYNFSHAADAAMFAPSTLVMAKGSEIDYSNNAAVVAKISPQPSAAIKLTDAAAASLGLTGSYVFGPANAPGANDDVYFKQPFDWSDPRWPAPGVAKPRYTAASAPASTATRRRRLARRDTMGNGGCQMPISIYETNNQGIKAALVNQTLAM